MTYPIPLKAKLECMLMILIALLTLYLTSEGLDRVRKMVQNTSDGIQPIKM